MYQSIKFEYYENFFKNNVLIVFVFSETISENIFPADIMINKKF